MSRSRIADALDGTRELKRRVLSRIRAVPNPNVTLASGRENSRAAPHWRNLTLAVMTDPTVFRAAPISRCGEVGGTLRLSRERYNPPAPDCVRPV